MDLIEVEKKYREIDEIIVNSSIFLSRGYMAKKESYEILEPSKEIENIEYENNIRVIKIEKFIYEKNERLLDKLENIFTGLYGNETSLFLLLKSDGKKCDFYIGVKETKKSVLQGLDTLKRSLEGNFPGLVYDNQSTKEFKSIVDESTNEEVCEISLVTGIPSLKDDDRRDFIQGLDSVVNGMEGKEFTAIFLADPINYKKVQQIKSVYEDLYTQLHPLNTKILSLTQGEARALSESVATTFSKNYSKNLSRTDTNSSAISETNSSTTTGFTIEIGSSESQSGSYTKTTGSSDTNGISYGNSDSESKSTGKTNTNTSGRTLQITEKNKKIDNILNKIEKYLERIEVAEAEGFWNIGAYFISKEPQNSVIAANIYNGAIRGQGSTIEKNGVYSFREKGMELKYIRDYLYNLSNPEIKITEGSIRVNSTIGSMVTTNELPLKINFPTKSVSGLDVMSIESFGRNTNFKNSSNEIEVGNLYHLGKEKEAKVELDIESLASHTFITGSTGAGKSNAVYVLLDELYKKKIKFMVIEPAKGEYKNVFGGRDDVSVYGTNNDYSELLRINPFTFNKKIHILEHIDRLVEIFNACWPMFAAMPAILKEAIELSYEDLGWILEKSKSVYNTPKYPTLIDVEKCLENIINKSSYSDQTKGDYTGALVTRIKSLTRGVTGNLFKLDEIAEKDLFDKNVIIDLSRVPSMESKSLIMGLLFMKLQEYRMSTSEGKENEKLKHVTVLEEAHNLLKKTSIQQSQESSNLQGKSVEMITNSISEMRTYGEGFIIADQAPDLLDEAVIRNTNTKICLRLPNRVDSEIIGKAMNLTDKQITELSRLETGVAVVIQNDWWESILVKFKFMNNKQKFNYENKVNSDILKNEIESLIEDINLLLTRKEDGITSKNIKKKKEEIIQKMNVPQVVKWLNNTAAKNDSDYIKELRIVVTNMLDQENNEFITKIITILIDDLASRDEVWIDIQSKLLEEENFKIW